jgi:rhamnose transport system permease protein
MENKKRDKTNFKASFGRFRQVGLLAFIIILSIVVQMGNSNFFTMENLHDMLKNAAILGILAIGMMMVIITRGIDLSIGATLALSGMATALTVANNPGLPIIGALGIGIGVGLACGLVIGLLVAKLNILPIIATLGMMNVYRGLTYIISNGAWVSANQMSASFKSISTSSFLGVSTLIWIAAGLFVMAFYFLEYTRTGRRIYAVGSNPDSARVSGINCARTYLIVYAIMGMLSGLAGVLWVSKFASAQGDTATGYEMSVIAACVLGGVSIAGGSGKISGIVLGALLLGIINNALPLVHISAFWETALQGLIILVAVLLNVFVKRVVDKRNLSRRAI